VVGLIIGHVRFGWLVTASMLRHHAGRFDSSPNHEARRKAYPFEWSSSFGGSPGDVCGRRQSVPVCVVPFSGHAAATKRRGL